VLGTGKPDYAKVEKIILAGPEHDGGKIPQRTAYRDRFAFSG